MPLRQADRDLYRLYAVGLPTTVVHQLLALIKRWVDHSGEEWTVGRLKTLKVDMIRYMAGLPPVGLYYTRRPDGTPSGPFGYLFKLIIKDRTSAVRALNAILVYSGFKSLKLTAKQWSKFYNSMTRALPSKESIQSARQDVILGLSSMSVRDHVPSRYRNIARPIVLRQGSPEKRAPIAGYGSLPEDVAGVASMAILSEMPNFTRRFAKFLLPVVPNYPIPLVSTGDPFKTEYVISGSIGVIQEPGYKARVIANPNRIFQEALRPLGAALFGLLRKIPEDSCFSQERGVQRVHQALKDGRMINSFDLSNATDRFPLELQVVVLEKAGFDRSEIEFFKALAQGEWELPRFSPNQRRSETQHWTVGQPLGLYPSFALFSLAHHAIVRGIAIRLQRPVSCYAILGDDICVWDQAVADEYERVMTDLGCDIASDKSLKSDVVAEFAGKVIHKSFGIMGTFKYRARNDNSFLMLVRAYGLKRSKRLLTSRQKRVALWVSPLSRPSGLGQNPEGISLSERVSRELFLMDRHEEKRSRPRIAGVPSASHRVQAATYGLHEDDLSREARGLKRIGNDRYINLLRDRSFWPGRLESAQGSVLAVRGSHAPDDLVIRKPSFLDWELWAANYEILLREDGDSTKSVLALQELYAAVGVAMPHPFEHTLLEDWEHLISEYESEQTPGAQV